MPWLLHHTQSVDQQSAPTRRLYATATTAVSVNKLSHEARRILYMQEVLYMQGSNQGSKKAQNGAELASK